MKQQEQLSKEFYLNKCQIARLLGTTRQEARKIFEIAELKDAERFKEYRPEPSKVRMSQVLKVYGITYEELQKRINA